jgi:hypothetical protein
MSSVTLANVSKALIGFVYRRLAFSLRFPDGACRLVAGGRSMFHHRVLRVVDYIL